MVIGLIAQKRDKIPPAYQIRDIQSRYLINCLGQKNKRFKFGTTAYGLLLTPQVRLHDHFYLFMSTDPGRVLPYFVEFDLNGGKPQKVKKQQDEWKKEIADAKLKGVTLKPYPETFSADPGKGATKPFDPAHSKARKFVVQQARGMLRVRHMLAVVPPEIKNSLQTQHPDWFLLPAEDTDLKIDYGGVEGRPPLPPPVAYYKPTGELYQPKWMLEGLERPLPESMEDNARLQDTKDRANSNRLLVDNSKTKRPDLGPSTSLKVPTTTPASIKRPHFLRLDEILPCQAMHDTYVSEAVDEDAVE